MLNLDHISRLFLVFLFGLWAGTGLLVVLSISSDFKEDNEPNTLQSFRIDLSNTECKKLFILRSVQKQDFSRVNFYVYDHRNSDVVVIITVLDLGKDYYSNTMVANLSARKCYEGNALIHL